MTETPILTPGTVYAVTFEPRPDPRRAPKFVTRKLRFVETYTLADGRTFFRFEPIRTGYRVTLAARELVKVEAV